MYLLVTGFYAFLSHLDYLYAAVAAYLCGCFNGALFTSRLFFHDDVRTHGSGNAGLTNFYRTYGARYALLVISCEMLKAVAAVSLAAWLGAHADGEEDLLAVALREVREESGVKHARPASENIFSLEVLTVDGHEKRGAYVSSHLHLNVTYLLIADDSDALTVKPDENSGVRWFTPEGAIEASSEPWFRERIYKKLNAKLAALR